MTARRIALSLIGGMAASMLAGPPAQAATGDVSFLYDWSADAQHGFEGFGVPEATNPDPGDPLNQPPMTATLQPPYYAAFAGTRGRGFRLQPSPASDGTRDRVFPNYRIGDASGGPRVAVAFTAPGTLEIRSATVQDVEFLNDNEGQILRFAYRRPNGATAFGFDFDRTAGPPGPFLPGVPYTGAGPVRLDAADALPEARKRVELSLRTICSQSEPENNRCPTVRFSPDAIPTSTARIGSMRLELFDPEPPSISATGPLAERDDWTNSRGRRTVALNAADPGAGVQRITLARAGAGTASTNVVDRAVDCDPLHRTARPAPYAGNVCPDAAAAAFNEDLAARRSGTTTYTATVSDLSGRSATKQFRLRIDREAPSATMGRLPSSLTSRYSSRDDPLMVPVAGRDNLSGVAAVRITAAAATRTTQICAAADCPTATNSPVPVDLGDLPDGRVTLKLSAVDRAGNSGRAQTAGVILLDRRPPRAVRNARAARLADDDVRVSWSAASDPKPGSGLDDYRYALFDAAGHRLRVGSTSSTAVRLGSLGAARTVTVRATDRAGLLGPASDAVIPLSQAVAARPSSRGPSGRKRQQRPRRTPRRNRSPRRRTVAIQYKGKAKIKKKGRLQGCRWTQFRASVSGREMRGSARGSCVGTKMYFAFNCIVHQESLGPFDSLDRDTDIDCQKRGKLRKRVGPLNVRADCDKRFDDNKYEAKAVMLVVPLFRGDLVQKERRLRPKCDEKAVEPRCRGDVPGRGGRLFVVYLGYVVNIPRYVGITRQALAARCGKHVLEARSFSGDIRGLDRLTPLSSYQAHGVEQAVIESLGTPFPRRALENDANSIALKDPRYCRQIRVGRTLLRAAGYLHLAIRRYPLVDCP